MDIKDCRIDMNVITSAGRSGGIIEIYNNGAVQVELMGGSIRLWSSETEPVSDPCTDCRKLRKDLLEQIDATCYWKTMVKPLLEEKDRSGQKLAERQAKLDKSYTRFGELDRMLGRVRKERDQWKCIATGHKRNAAYWREELTKLQKEAMADSKPVTWAEYFKQVEPEKLLMSQEARRVEEYLKSRTQLAHFGGILEGMKNIMSGMAITDGIIELRDAGMIALVDGKYQIAGD